MNRSLPVDVFVESVSQSVSESVRRSVMLSSSQLFPHLLLLLLLLLLSSPFVFFLLLSSSCFSLPMESRLRIVESDASKSAVLYAQGAHFRE